MIQRNEFKRLVRPFLIVGLGSLFYVYEFFLRVMPSALTHVLMRDLNMHAGALGMMSACFFYAYAPLQIPAGLVCDRFGPKRALTAAIALCSLATVLFAAANTVWLGAFTRFLTGMASSLAFVGPLALAARWYPAKYFALIAGLVQLMGSVGAIFGGGPVAALAHQLGWRETMVWTASVGLVLTVLFFLILKDGPETDPDLRQEDPGVTTVGEQWVKLKQLCKHNQVVWLGMVSFCCWAPMSVFAELWGVSFVQTAYHVSATKAATAISWVWVAVAIGSPLGGWWSDRIQSRRIPLMTFFAIGFLTSSVILFHHFQGWAAFDLMMFLFGLTAAAQPVTFGFIRDITPDDMTATAVGYNNMCVIAGATLLQPLVGFMLQRHWAHDMLDHAPVYRLENFQHALLILPMVSILGLILVWFKLRETHCEDVDLLKDQAVPSGA